MWLHDPPNPWCCYTESSFVIVFSVLDNKPDFQQLARFFAIDFFLKQMFFSSTITVLFLKSVFLHVFCGYFTICFLNGILDLLLILKPFFFFLDLMYYFFLTMFLFSDFWKYSLSQNVFCFRFLQNVIFLIIVLFIIGVHWKFSYCWNCVSCRFTATNNRFEKYFARIRCINIHWCYTQHYLVHKLSSPKRKCYQS